MKKIICSFAIILLSVSLYAQVAKVSFIDGTKGFAMGPKLTFNRVGDTLTFESADQMLWQQVVGSGNPSLTSKQGVIQKIASSNQDTYAKVVFVDGSSADLIEDCCLGLFSVGDTVKMVKRKNTEGDEMCKIYFGQLPGSTTKEEQINLVVIKKIFR